MNTHNKVTVNEYNKSVDSLSDRLYRFILKSIKDEDTAMDIVQDSFEKLWINRDTVIYDKVKSYLFKVAYNKLIDHTRKQGREIRADIIPEQETDNQYSDLKEILEIALNKLPEKFKSVIMLRDYEGYSYKEISEIMEMNEALVKINIYRGRLILKEFIGSVATVI